MGFFIGLMTAVLLINCILLVLLVLIQLPKKEAGLGLAFGGGAADALFGAGSGNVLTKATKYAAVLFFVLCIALGIFQGRYFKRNTTELLRALETVPVSTPALPATSPAVPTPPPATTGAPAATVTTPIVVPPAATTSAPIVLPPATSAPPAQPPRQ
jgi:preprotein translocase subunit SecG